MPPKKAASGMKMPCAVAPKVKPPGMADEDWAKELARRAIVTADQQRHRAIQRQANAEAAQAACSASYAASLGFIDGGGS
jgi:hypothetical protein